MYYVYTLAFLDEIQLLSNQKKKPEELHLKVRKIIT